MLFRLQIDMFGKDTQFDRKKDFSQTEWITIAKRVQGPVFKLENLQPNKAYIFLIRAENSHGLSMPSAVSEPVSLSTLTDDDDNNGYEKSLSEEKYTKEARASLLSGPVVELLAIQSQNSSSIKLIWEVRSRKYKSILCWFFFLFF